MMKTTTTRRHLTRAGALTAAVGAAALMLGGCASEPEATPKESIQPVIDALLELDGATLRSYASDVTDELDSALDLFDNADAPVDEITATDLEWPDVEGDQMARAGVELTFTVGDESASEVVLVTRTPPAEGEEGYDIFVGLMPLVGEVSLGEDGRISTIAGTELPDSEENHPMYLLPAVYTPDTGTDLIAAVPADVFVKPGATSYVDEELAWEGESSDAVADAQKTLPGLAKKAVDECMADSDDKWTVCGYDSDNESKNETVTWSASDLTGGEPQFGQTDEGLVYLVQYFTFDVTEKTHYFANPEFDIVRDHEETNTLELSVVMEVGPDGPVGDPEIEFLGEPM